MNTLVTQRELITPSDTEDMQKQGAVMLYIGTGGNIKYSQPNGNIITETLTAGYHYIPMVRVYATGTTATGLYALYTQ